jgi:1-acyl-sn-glycerol-3-phosphate acyltransferase
METNGSDTLKSLVEINLQEMMEAAGLARARLARPLIEYVFRPAARKFARQMTQFDELVGSRGLRDGAAWVLKQNVRGMSVSGLENIPPEGPLLIVANHPGLSDTVALFASYPRDDLRVIAIDRPFLRALSNTSKHLIYLDQSVNSIFRRITKHLRSGGSVLIFPAGDIEPDPAFDLAAATSSLRGWSKSIGVLARQVSDVRIVPAIVRGVVCASARKHPITRLRKAEKERERFAALLQVVIPAYRNVTVSVTFGPAIERTLLCETNADPRMITERLIDHVGCMMGGDRFRYSQASEKLIF